MGGVGYGVYTMALVDMGNRFTGSALVAGNAAFGLMWGVGGMIGPPSAGFFMQTFGPVGLPAMIAVLSAILVGSRRSVPLPGVVPLERRSKETFPVFGNHAVGSCDVDPAAQQTARNSVRIDAVAAHAPCRAFAAVRADRLFAARPPLIDPSRQDIADLSQEERLTL
jgi:hypothetical protein